MLIECPECRQQVSDKAVACPHCGCPISHKPPPRPKRSNKKMRLPNGFGRITELKGNHRKPFRAMVSDGVDENGRPIGRLLKPQAYFTTYNEAYKALIAYHDNPYDFANDLTVKEVFDRWYAEKSKTVGKKRQVCILSAWSFCKPIYDKKIQLIRTRELKELFVTASKVGKDGNIITPSDNVRSDMKYVLSGVLSYAVEYELISHNYMEDITLKPGNSEVANEHIAFTDEEMFALWNNEGQDQTVDMILFQCYTGMRPNELCNIELENIHLDEWYLIGGSKTKAGKNRTIPIHERIRPILTRKYNQAISEGQRYLFQTNYESYRYSFNTILSKYNLDPKHRPHDPRKQFVTMAKKAGVDSLAVKRIVGHAVKDITEDVYTQIDIEWLHKEIAKIK